MPEIYTLYIGHQVMYCISFRHSIRSKWCGLRGLAVLILSGSVAVTPVACKLSVVTHASGPLGFCGPGIDNVHGRIRVPLDDDLLTSLKVKDLQPAGKKQPSGELLGHNLSYATQSALDLAIVHEAPLQQLQCP